MDHLNVPRPQAPAPRRVPAGERVCLVIVAAAGAMLGARMLAAALVAPGRTWLVWLVAGLACLTVAWVAVWPALIGSRPCRPS